RSGPPLVGREDAPQYRAGELARQAVLVDGVPQLAVQPRSPYTSLFRSEAGLLVRAEPGEVERDDGQFDAVQAEGGEGVVEHQARGLGAVAAPPVRRLGDADGERGRPVAPVDPHQAGVADRPSGGAIVDGEEVVVVRQREALVLAPLLLQRGWPGRAAA